MTVFVPPLTKELTLDRIKLLKSDLLELYINHFLFFCKRKRFYA